MYLLQERFPLLLSLAGDAHPGRSENGAYGSLREAVWIGWGSVAVGVHLGVHLVLESCSLDVAWLVRGSAGPGEQVAPLFFGHFALEAVGLEVIDPLFAFEVAGIVVVAVGFLPKKLHARVGCLFSVEEQGRVETRVIPEGGGSGDTGVEQAEGKAFC